MSTSFSGPVPSPQPQTAPINVLITGAARGIGFELVKQYITAFPGNIVIAAVRDIQGATALNQLATTQPNLHIIHLDVSSEDSIRASLPIVQPLISHLDILINNAGILGDKTGQDPTTATSAALTAVFNTNVVGALVVTQTYLPLLRRASAPKVGNISSRLGSNAFANRWKNTLSYGLSKAALNYLNTALRYAVPEVTFLALHPGWVATDMGSTLGKPPVQPHEAAQAIRYYLSEKTTEQSGEFIDVVSGSILPY